MHWPLGTLRQRFLPTPTGANDGFTISPLLQPFETAGLHLDLSVLYGLKHPFQAVGGGGNEAGTVFAVTGTSSPGTRQNGGELVRVATLMWCSGTNHVAFAGMNPFDKDAIYEMGSFHYRESYPTFYSGAPPASDAINAFVYETLFGMFRWLNQQTADVLAELKAAKDVYGGNLLDSTIVPYVTDQSQPTDERSPLPALLLGGRALGMQGGKFLNFSPTRSHNDLWMTIAQAFLKSNDPSSVLADEKFVMAGAQPIAGLWAPI